MIKRPEIGSKALRAGRVSEVGRLYFITKNAGERVRPDWTPAERLAQGRLVQPGVPERYQVSGIRRRIDLTSNA